MTEIIPLHKRPLGGKKPLVDMATRAAIKVANATAKEIIASQPKLCQARDFVPEDGYYHTCIRPFGECLNRKHVSISKREWW